MAPKGKEDVLEHTYGIPMNYELKNMTKKLCNLSDLVDGRRIEKGLKQGTELKLISQVWKKLKKSYIVT